MACRLAHIENFNYRCLHFVCCGRYSNSVAIDVNLMFVTVDLFFLLLPLSVVDFKLMMCHRCQPYFLRCNECDKNQTLHYRSTYEELLIPGSRCIGMSNS